MLNENTLTKFQVRLNSHRDAIINHIRKIHPNSDIKVMTNKSEMLNRGKHFGAHICVDSTHYYYITFSRKDEYCEHYFSINTDLLSQLKNCKEDFHLLLISGRYVYTFDAKTIVDNAKLFNKTTYKISLLIANSKDEADFRSAYNEESKNIIDFRYLGNVRYSMKFDMHKKQITIVASEYKYKRTFDSIVKAYAALTGTKVEDGRAVGKPVENAAYKKSYMSFRREVKAGCISLLNDSGKIFKASVLFNVIPTVVTEAPAEVNTSLLVANKFSTNSDVFTSEPENCNTEKDGGQRRLDKELDIIADKLVEKETVKYTSAEIQKTIVSFGSNRNMLAAYTLGLTEKGLYKEAAYAAKVFEALNNISY